MHCKYVIALATAALFARSSSSSPASAEDDCRSPASTVALGAGCGATISATLPIVGQRTTIDVRTELGNSRGWLFFSPPGATVRPIQGCDVFMQYGALATLATFTTDAAGAASVSLLVPSSPRLCGQEYVVQALISSSSGARTFGAVSNGLHVTLGNRAERPAERRPLPNGVRTGD